MNPYHLTVDDEYDHRPTDDENFNESVYVNGFDLGAGLGGWMRIGKRVNEGHAEVQACFYLPDGRVACQFKRPGIDRSEGFAAAGMSYEVIEPHRSVRMTYDGPMMLLDDPEVLRDSRKLFGQAPVIDAAIDLTLDAVSEIHGGDPVDDSQVTWYPRDFSRSHYFQHTRTTGAVRIGDEEFVLDGHGWRDHSWGPRHWTNIHYYRLLICTFGDNLGFTLLKITDRDGKTLRHGVLHVDGELEEIEDYDLTTSWTERKDPTAMTLSLRTAKRAAQLHGTVTALAPLSNKRKIGDEILRSRISEGITVWDWDGRKGLGISEYIERVGADGPVGFPN